MEIALVNNHYDKEHLEAVKKEMLILGAPKIHAVWMECYDLWAALEGCHRIRAAKSLGLIPEIIEVEYSENLCSTIPGYDGDEDYTISSAVDDSHKAISFTF
jgi:hypothetical protein